MWSILKGEWRKLRRCQILLVGIVAVALCPVVQYGTQLIVNPEIRDTSFDFVSLFANVIWGNTQIFLPLSLVMIGGWLIDRENTNDTMKNLLTVPVSYPKLLGGKLKPPVKRRPEPLQTKRLRAVVFYMGRCGMRMRGTA